MKIRQSLALTCLIGFCMASVSPVLAETVSTAAPAARTSAPLAPARTTSSDITVSSGKQVFNARLLQNLGNLTIAPGASAIIDFGRNPILNIAGNITNLGSIYAVSTNPAVTSASIHSLNIFNNQGALLSTIVPASALAGITNTVPNLNLSLVAVNNIVNAGTISSAGNLSMQAGNLISNQGVVSAARDVNILAGAGNLVNAGAITSLAGNINLSSLATQNLIINNASGSMQALLGNISAATLPGADKVNLEILGGDLAANAINLTNMSGNVDVNVDNLTGPLNISACAAHVNTSTPQLVLGRMDLLGDPTFYNSGGDVVISQDLDLTPINYVRSQVSLAIVASGDISGTSALKSIKVSTMTSPQWIGDQNCGSVMLVAGAQFTPSTSSQVDNDTSTTLTITGASATGGQINLPGVNVGTQAGMTGKSAISGNVTLVAYGGPGANAGNITIGNISTGEGQPAQADDIYGLNGTVTIVGAGNITTGAINTTGNTVVPFAWNGSVTIASAAVKMMQSTLAQQPNNLNPTVAATSTNPPLSTNNIVSTPGATSFTVTDATGMAVGTVLYLNPLGANAEKVTVSSVNGTTITVSAPMANYHSLTERIYTDAAQVVINPGAGGLYPMVPITQNGAMFAPDLNNLKSGTITIGGQIASGANVNIATTGNVNVNGSIGLTQNPTSVSSITAPDYLAYPSIDIRGNAGVTIASGVTVSSQISGCSLCPNTVNIVTQNLTNNGLITGGAAATVNPSNSMVSVTSPGSLTLSGTGSIVVPASSVIELAAADKGTLTLGSSHVFSTGAQGLVIFNAQGNGGTIEVTGGSVETINGGPVVSINTPNLLLDNASQINASGESAIAIGSGYTNNPLSVTVTGSASITTGTKTGAIKMRPNDTNSLTIGAVAPATLTLTGSNVLLSATDPGTITLSNVTLAGTAATQTQNPSGGINGVAFQPYVGGLRSSGDPNFVAYGGYPYQTVLAMLAPLAGEQQFQILSTYTQQYSATWVIQAAKQVGMRVSAGVFLNIDPSGSIIGAATTNSDIQRALTYASLYGNVVDIVVGNEDIVGGASPGPSINTLKSQILAVQALRNSTNDPVNGGTFTSTTLPVTTRQIDGVLNLVNNSGSARPEMVQLVQSCEDHIYGNFYPFYNQSTVIPALIADPGMPYSTFKTLVTGYMSTDFTTIATNFQNYVITSIPKVWVSETGWATAMQDLPVNGPNYKGSSLPQSTLNPNWPAWFYKAMQSWSFTAPNMQTAPKNGVPVLGYFASFNEPWKGINGGNPNNTAVFTAGAAASGSTQLVTTNGAAFANLTPQSILINPGQANQEVQNLVSISSNTLTISALLSSHNSGESINAGTPEEPFFGIWRALGTSWSDGSVYTLGSYSRKYTLPVYDGTAFVEPVPGPALLNDLNDSNLKQTDSLIAMQNGKRLFAPQHDLVVSTRLAEIKISAGSAVLVVQDKSGVAVMNLHDKHSGAVLVGSGTKFSELPVGRQVVLGDNDIAAFDEVNPSCVAYRHVAEGRVGGTRSYTAEFSIPSALTEFAELAALRSSSKKADRQLLGKILKTAAAMNIVGRQDTPFRTSRKLSPYLAAL